MPVLPASAHVALAPVAPRRTRTLAVLLASLALMAGAIAADPLVDEPPRPAPTAHADR